MTVYYLLWATGEDHSGIVASVTEILFKHHCNIEDSSMMRLGSEFGILLIFTSKNSFNLKDCHAWFKTIEQTHGLTIGVKKISASQAKFRPIQPTPMLITVHGADQAGLVYHVTSLLSKIKFNVTDLATHRTTSGPQAGYILLIEGELPRHSSKQNLKKRLAALGIRLGVKMTVQLLTANAF